MTRRPERIDYDSAHGELRLLLADWDPIGVDPGSFSPEDEYDYLIPGLYGRLRAGERDDEILAFAFLENQLVNHFGLEPVPHRDRAFAGELVRWCETRSSRAS